jgi:hypothetical protein
MTQFSQVPVENGIANKTKRTTALEKERDRQGNRHKKLAKRTEKRVPEKAFSRT